MLTISTYHYFQSYHSNSLSLKRVSKSSAQKVHKDELVKNKKSEVCVTLSDDSDGSMYRSCSSKSLSSQTSKTYGQGFKSNKEPVSNNEVSITINSGDSSNGSLSENPRTSKVIKVKT